MNFQPPRIPFFFWPFLFFALMTLFWVSSNTWQPSGSALPPEIKQQLARQQVTFAIEALRRGDGITVANRLVRDVAQVIGGTSTEVTLVAEEILRQHDPTFAALFLQNATTKPEWNWDPMLWATLAKAYRQANNPEEAAPAEYEAEKRADAILQTKGKGKPADKEPPSAQTLTIVSRFLQASYYFSEIKQDSERAIEAAREAHTLLPENWATQNALGYTLADQGTTRAHREEALLLTERATKAVPESGIVRDSYGWALYKIGNVNQALRVLQEAAEMEPEIPEIQYHLAVVYRDLGLIRQSEIALSRALAQKPNYPEAEKLRTQ